MKGLKRLLLASVLCAGYAITSWGIGAYPHPILLKQPDGTTLLVRIQGDENFHFVTTTDGFLLQKDKKGFFRYVNFDEKTKKKTLTKLKAHNIGERTDKEKDLLKTLASAKTINDETLSTAKIVKKAPKVILDRSVVAPQRVAGTRAAAVKESQYLVILVNFQDSVMRHTRDDFDKWLNQPGYSENGGTGSVKDYYRDNSMGQFIPNFQVVGPYTLSQPTKYYGHNTSESSASDENPREMVMEAVNLAKKNHPELDFHQFDNDGDGVMDNCYVIYAGYSEASTANDDDIWPHSWYLEDGFSVDGVQVKDYSCSAELVGMPGAPKVPSMDGIGTFTHEFGHVLGLKDQYDTDDTNNGKGIDPGAYSLYASGSYNNDSRTPPCLMAFERMQMGWAKEGTDIVEVKNAEDVTLENLSENKARFINCQPDRKPGTGMEWFILENRQQTGWDKYIPAHGLLITHYDYTDEMKKKWWDVNGPNNSSKHRCMYIVPADGTDDNASREGDTYPGTSGNTSFTDTTTPNSLNWANEPLNVPITNIMEEDGKVRFQVSGGTSVWNFIKTDAPDDILDTKATFKAEVLNHNADIDEVGFCWKKGSAEAPTLDDAEARNAKVDDNDTPVFAATGLEPATTYSVRSYMKMSDGKVIYGSPVAFTTEWPYANVTLENPLKADLASWTGGTPDGWQIIDNNGDGNTWTQDATTKGALYIADNWNDADDYLICKRRIHVPERGTLFFTRGVTEQTAIETLDVLVSTKTSKKDDFHLVKRFSLADNFDQQYMEEVDLSQYVGKDIYVAFRVCSEKLQGDLWLWNMLVTKKLETPKLTQFERTGAEELTASWTPVKGADNYYLSLDMETDTVNCETIFTPMEFYQAVKGDVSLGTGSVWFKSSGSVTLKDCPEGIQNCQFVVTTSGPMGSSEMTLEGTEDGTTWKTIGSKITLSEYDSDGQEEEYKDYLKDKNYRQLRINFKHGGRSARIKYLTLTYNNGMVYKNVAAGSVTNNSIIIRSKDQGEFDTNKYRVWVAAGRGNLYYDESAPMYYEKNDPTCIKDIIEGTGISVSVDDNNIQVGGIKPGYIVTCTSASGVQLYTGEATSDGLSFSTPAMKGVAIITVSGEGKTYRSKIIIK